MNLGGLILPLRSPERAVMSTRKKQSRFSSTVQSAKSRHQHFRFFGKNVNIAILKQGNSFETDFNFETTILTTLSRKNVNIGV